MANSITLQRAYIDTFKAKWPCHGLPDNLAAIRFEFAASGDLVDMDATSDDGTALDTHNFDGPALVALSQDAAAELRINETLAVWGADLTVGARVELSPSTDRWMQGDRLGKITHAQ